MIAALDALRLPIIFIPGGLTSHYQPLDIGVNAPFKHWIRERNTTEEQAIEAPERQRIQMATNIIEAFNELDTSTIINSNHMLIQRRLETDEFDEIDV